MNDDVKDNQDQPSEEVNPVPNLLMLKLLVVGLGVMLVVAAITFVILMVTVGPKSVREARAAEKAATEEALMLEQAQAANRAELPKELTIDLPDDAVITGTQLDGDMLILTLYTNEGQEIVLVEMASGEIRHQIKVK